MAKFILAVYLSASVVLGPVWCCCSASIFFPCENSGKTPSHSEYHARCQHRCFTPSNDEVYSPNERDALTEAKAPSGRSSHKCPCKDHLPSIAALIADEEFCLRHFDLIEWHGARLEWHYPLAALASFKAMTPTSFECEPALPTGRDILRQCHKLQC